MVGGRVIGTARKGDGTTLLHVQDTNQGGDTCAVRVGGVRHVEVRPGDEVWWQCGKVMWTPAATRHGKRQGVDFDIVLQKVGYSH
jgi:hypothetical protein